MINSNPFLSIVVPVYNESETLGLFLERITPILRGTGLNYELVFVNDGSADNTLDILIELHAKNAEIKVINLSRNFGKEPALTAGLEYCTGDIVIPMDVDLQDPPELIPDMIDRWQAGYDVVLAVRTDRSTDSFMKRLTATGFYRFFSRVSDVDLPGNAGDFRLMDRRVVEALRRLPERTRFMKGLFAWLGFKQTQIHFTREQRSAGEGKWGGWKLWNFALDGIFSFSTAPLRIWSYLGFFLSLFSLFYLLYIITDTLIYGNDVPGYPSLVAISLFFNGAILMGLGIVGEYVGRIFIETKQRPIYLIRDTLGFDTRKTECQDRAG